MKMMRFLSTSKIIILILLTVQLFIGAVSAQPVSTPTPGSLNYERCRAKFQDPNYARTYSDLYYSVRAAEKNGTDNPLYLADCPPSLDDITFVIVRLITVIITIIGLFILAMLIKNSILIMTAGANKDKIKAARGGFQSTIMGLIIIFISYSLIIFIATRLGLTGNTDPSKPSFFLIDGGRIVFRFIFPDYNP